MPADLDAVPRHAAQSRVTSKRKRGRPPTGSRRRINRSIPPRPAFDLDKLSPSVKLTALEVAGLMRCTPGTIDRMCGDDPNNPFRPLHPITVKGKRLFSVANVRSVLEKGVPRKNQKASRGRSESRHEA